MFMVSPISSQDELTLMVFLSIYTNIQSISLVTPSFSGGVTPLFLENIEVLF